MKKKNQHLRLFLIYVIIMKSPLRYKDTKIRIPDTIQLKELNYNSHHNLFLRINLSAYTAKIVR